MRKKILFCGALGWTLIIGVLCLISFNDLPDMNVKVPNADKYVHATFHFIFTTLWYFYFRSLAQTGNGKPLVKVLLMSFVYGILIELAQQAFTTTRQADILDVMANFTGGITAVMLLLAYEKYRKKQPYNK